MTRIMRIFAGLIRANLLHPRHLWSIRSSRKTKALLRDRQRPNAFACPRADSDAGGVGIAEEEVRRTGAGARR